MEKFGSRWLYGEIWWLTFLMSIPLALLGFAVGLALGRHLWRGFKSAWKKSEDECRALQEQAAKHSEELEHLETQLQQTTADLGKYEQRVREVEAKHLELLNDSAKLKRSHISLEAALSSARAERDDMSALATRFREEATELSSSNARIAELCADLDEADAQVSRLKKQLALSNSIREEMEALQSNDKELEIALEELRVQAKQAEHWREQATELEKECNALRARASSPAGSAWSNHEQEELSFLSQVAASSTSLGTEEETEPIPAALEDDLTQIKGLSEEEAKALLDLGIRRFADLASLDDLEVEEISGTLSLGERVTTERWREQAAVLHEEKYGEDLTRTSRNESPAEVSPVPTVDPELGILFTQPPPSQDDLTQIKGVAETLKHRLHDFGIYQFRQIALWSEENLEAISKRLSFKDRIRKEQWREQCQRLHEAKYGEILQP